MDLTSFAPRGDPKYEQHRNLGMTLTMLGWLRKNKKPETSRIALRPFDVELAVDQPFYAVGDVHGCFDQMKTVLENIDADIERTGNDDAVLVMLGDYVDRGEKSADVLSYLMDLQKNDPAGVICLKGNHEQMMIDFIDDPATAGGRWLRYGGLQTLASFGIRGVTERSDADEMLDACDELCDAMPAGMIDWLGNLSIQYTSGNVHCVHAALDPDRPAANQPERIVVWGHKDFETQLRTDGAWVVHGHTVVDTAQKVAGRIPLDTGCYYTGRLSAAAFKGSECRFL